MYHQFSDLTTCISEEELRQLVDDENAGSIVQGPPPNAAMQRITENGAKAQRLIDGYCRGRYTVPLTPTPDIIKDMSVELTIYNCMMRKKEIALSEEQKRRYDTIIAQLKDIQGGRIKLFDDRGNPPSYPTNRTDIDRIFTDDVLKEF